LAREIELKFDMEPGAAGRLRRVSLLAGADGRRADYETVYFDTPDGALRREGYSLRVRASGDGFIQTAKRKGDGVTGLFVRDEWEQAVPSLAVDRGALKPAALKRLVARSGGVLEIQAVTRFTRTTWPIRHKGSRIELMFDEGMALAGGRETPIREMEIELKRGRPKALFEVAEAIGAAVPLRLGVLSKGERAQALAAGSLGAPARALPLRSEPGTSEGDAFRAAANASLRQYRLNVIALLAGENPEALHQARVALRRLCSALSLYRSTARGDSYRALRDDLAWFAGHFAAARDLDVMSACGLFDPEALRPERDRAHRRMMSALRSRRARATMLRLALWIELGAWRFRPKAARPAAALARERLDRQWRALERRGAAIGTMETEALHRLRIETKKLRYAAEFLFGLHPGPKPRAFVDALKALQDALGGINDAWLARETARRHRPINPLPDADATDREGAARALRRAAKSAGYWASPEAADGG